MAIGTDYCGDLTGMAFLGRADPLVGLTLVGLTAVGLTAADAAVAAAVWQVQDWNLRRLTPTDLQSATVGVCYVKLRWWRSK